MALTFGRTNEDDEAAGGVVVVEVLLLEEWEEEVSVVKSIGELPLLLATTISSHRDRRISPLSSKNKPRGEPTAEEEGERERSDCQRTVTSIPPPHLHSLHFLYCYFFTKKLVHFKI